MTYSDWAHMKGTRPAGTYSCDPGKKEVIKDLNFMLRIQTYFDQSLTLMALAGISPLRSLGFQVTFFQLRGADCAHHITASPPGFET